ncbi:heterokaryon incompatibility protein-domain-containing protein [Lenzites betulinus]|nr:heterokaryon incompatibility protein-domain-containing protein [Lenzites betulinus]
MGSAISRVLAPAGSTWPIPPCPSTVCQACWKGPFAAHLGLFNAIVRDQWLGVPRFIGGYSYLALRAEMMSQAKTCSWCSLLLTMCDKDEDMLRITVGRLVDGNAEVSGSVVAHSVQQNIIILINDREVYKGYLHTSAEDPAAAHIVLRSPILDVGSSRTLDLVRIHLNECLHRHGHCMSLSSGASPVKLPTRLVDCTLPERPRLVSTATLPSHCKYLALSYLWGFQQEYGTCRANISIYEVAIDLQLLPQTIQDAIRLTHTLGYLFLWVDSLCIVQDSDEDKAYEINLLDQVYRGAFLTIIAASARTAREGFLHDRYPDTSRTVALPFLCPPRRHHPAPETASASSQSLVGSIRITPTFTLTEGDIQLYDPTRDPLHKRAWLMQELLMSQRALIFTSETVQFRCRTTTQNIGKSFYDPCRETRLPNAVFLQEPPIPAYDSEEWIAVHRSWRDIVEDYSEREVAFPHDRLVACSHGIARDLHRLLNTDYLAGLWRHTLLSDLLWFNTSATAPPCRFEYIAPSWSWASAEGQVKMEPYVTAASDRIALSEVLRCEVESRAPWHPFGEVVGGSLVLRTPALILCTIHGDTDSGGSRIQLHHAAGVSQRPGHPCTGYEPGGEGTYVAAKCFGTARIDNRKDDALSASALWFVPLSRRDKLLEGLLVTGCDLGPESEREVYRRVGLVHAPADRFRSLENSSAMMCIEIV